MVTLHHLSFFHMNIGRQYPVGTSVPKQVFNEPSRFRNADQAGSFAFEITNNPMADKKAVLVSADKYSHSASVGDVVEWDGQFVLINSMGFLDINAYEFQLLVKALGVPSAEEDAMTTTDIIKFLKALRSSSPPERLNVSGMLKGD